MPFVPLMNAKIKQAGQTPKTKIIEKAQQVYSIIKSEGNLEQENVIEDVTSIIQAVVKFFQGRRDRLEAKKEAGQELTEGEEKTIDHVNGIEEAVKDQASGLIKEKAKSYFSNPLVLVGAAVIVFLVVRKK